MDSLRRTLVTSAALVCMLLSAGLSSANASTPTRRTEAAAGTLTVVIGNEPSSLDPAVDYEVGCDVFSNVYDNLVRASGEKSVQIVPDLAVGWQSTQGSRVWTFHLRPNVRFHDGTKVNAQAIKYSFDRMLKIKQGAYSDFAEIARVDAVNQLTVRFHLKYRFAAFLASLTSLCGPVIVSPKTASGHSVSSSGASYLDRHDAGSGPYTLGSWQRGQRIVLKAFAGYWRGWSGHHPKTVVYTWPASSSTQRLQLEHGDIDATMNLSSRDFSAVAQEQGIRVVERTAQTFKDIRINTTKPGLNNVNIRKALSYAFDYQGVVRGVYQGHASRMYGIGSSGLKNFVRAPTPYVFNLNRARTLVKQSGVPKKNLSFTISYLPDDSQAIQMGQIFQSDLSHIGITAKLQGIPIATYGQLINKPSTDPEIWIGSWTMDYADNQQLYWSYYYSKNTPSNGGANFAYYKDPVTDRLLTQALHAANASAAYRLYTQACNRIYVAAPEVWPVQPNERVALRSNVHGYQYNFLYGANYYTVYNMYRS